MPATRSWPPPASASTRCGCRSAAGFAGSRRSARCASRRAFRSTPRPAIRCRPSNFPLAARREKKSGGGTMSMIGSKTLALALCLSALLAIPAGALAQMKIGYVDLQRALNESDAGKRAKERFKAQVDKLQGELKKQKDQLDSLKEQLEKKASVMKEEEVRNLQRDYERRLRDFERAYKDSQGELQQKD